MPICYLFLVFRLKALWLILAGAVSRPLRFASSVKIASVSSTTSAVSFQSQRYLLLSVHRKIVASIDPWIRKVFLFLIEVASTLIINLEHNAKGHIVTYYSFKVRLIVGIQFPTQLWSTPSNITLIMWGLNVGLTNCTKLQMTRAFMWSSPLYFTHESIKVFSFVRTRCLLDRERKETFCAFCLVRFVSFMELVDHLSL